MREVDELDDPVDQRVAKRDERDERAVRDTDDDRREEQVYGLPLQRPNQGGNRTRVRLPAPILHYRDEVAT